MCHVLSHFWLFVAPMDCHLPGSSVHWIFQARILEWISISYSRESSLWVIKPESPELHCRWTLYLLNHWRSPKVRWSSKSDGPNRQKIIRPGGSWASTPTDPQRAQNDIGHKEKTCQILSQLSQHRCHLLGYEQQIRQTLSQDLWAIRKQIRWMYSHPFLPICSLTPYTPARRDILYTLEANIHLLGDKLKIGVLLDVGHKMITLMAEDEPPRTKQVDLTGVNPKVWV